MIRNTVSVGVITYNYNHLKTEQVVKQLKNKGYSITLYLLPFIIQNKRRCVIAHRPDQFVGHNPIYIAKELSIDTVVCKEDKEITGSHDYYIIAGAGILSKEAIGGKRIINCHPGLIPIVRGLDAFKWAIFYGLPLGNTLHYIDDKVDLGRIIARKKTPIKIEDTIESLAQRHYDNEIEMLSDFELYVNADPAIDCLLEPKVNKINRRMTEEEERLVLQRFEEYKKKYCE